MPVRPWHWSRPRRARTESAVAPGPDPDPPSSEVVYGVHPVMELLTSRGHEIDRIFVVRGRHARLGPLLRAAREQGVPVSHVAREVLARKLGRQCCGSYRQ